MRGVALGQCHGQLADAVLHIYPLGLLVLVTVTAGGLVEVLIAAVAGACFYKEA